MPSDTPHVHMHTCPRDQSSQVKLDTRIQLVPAATFLILYSKLAPHFLLISRTPVVFAESNVPKMDKHPTIPAPCLCN